MRMSGHYLPLATIAWGLSLFFLFGNLEFLGKYDGLNGVPVLIVRSASLQSEGRSMFYLIWVVVLLAVLAMQKPAELAAGPCHPRARRAAARWPRRWA